MPKRLVIVALVSLYFCSMLWLSVGAPHVFPSPDENAIAVFAEQLRTEGTLGIFDAVNIPLRGIVHPRSVVVVQGFAMPGSFLGMPLFAGLFGALFGGESMRLLTPLLVMVALFAWHDLMRAWTKDRLFAAIATALLALHPALWYYAARSMMHNVPFVCALIIAAWLVWAQPLSRCMHTARARCVEWLLAGMGVGIALVFRTAEAPWVLVAIIALCVFSVRAAGWRVTRRGVFSTAMFAVGCALPLVVMMALQADLYGSPFVNGYTIEDTSGAHDAEAQLALAEADTDSVLGEIGAMLLPFGVHERAMVANVWHFGVSLFPWMTVLAVGGMAMTNVKKLTGQKGDEQAWRRLLVATLLLAAWLGVLYGSWSFNDNPNPAAVTIGDSHVRYWLPVFVLTVPFAARAVWCFARQFRNHVRTAVVTVGAVAVLSSVVVFGGEDGLRWTRNVLFASAAKRDAIIAATEDDAIIVVDRADKFLFPYRRVIQPLRNDTTYAAMPAAAAEAPLYYYGIPFPESDMTYLNTVKLAALGLSIAPVEAIGDETLYRITLVE